MRRYLFAATAAALLVAFVFPAAGFARSGKVEICHRSALGDAGIPDWRLLSVGGKAAEAHAAHGDGVPGGPVPEMAGYTFDASCVPEMTDSWIPVCLDGAFESFDLRVMALNTARGADLLSSTDGTCTGDLRGSLSVVDGSADREEARTACASVLGGSPSHYTPLPLAPLFLDAPANWWLCP